MSGAVEALQCQFQQHVLGAGDATAWIAGTPVQQQRGLEIYVNAYQARLFDTLADAYPTTQALMGPEAFEAVVQSYITQHPPTTRSLRWYGDQFAAHVAASGTLAQAELARLDWALRRAFDGPDAPVLDAAALAQVTPQAWATLRLTPVPTAELQGFCCNTVAVWQALNDELPPPPWQCADGEVVWLIWRKGLQPHFRSLSALEAVLLRRMMAGDTFAEACAAAQASVGLGQPEAEDITAQVGGFLRQWLADELLTAL